jgi:hypothetical protein
LPGDRSEAGRSTWAMQNMSGLYGECWSVPLERGKERVIVLLEDGWMVSKVAQRFDRAFKLVALARVVGSNYVSVQS